MNDISVNSAGYHRFGDSVQRHDGLTGGQKISTYKLINKPYWTCKWRHIFRQSWMHKKHYNIISW